MTRKISKIPQVQPGSEGSLVFLAMAAEMPGIRESAELMAEYAEGALARGDRAEALDWFARIVEGGEEELGPHASLRIGAVLIDDQPATAAAALRFAVDHGVEHVRETAQRTIELLSQHGIAPRPDPATIAEVVGQAHLGRGRLWTIEGDLDAAIDAYRDAAASPEADVAAAGLAHLGSLQAHTGDPAAQETLQRAIAAGHPQHAASAGVDLATLLINRGELDRAVGVLRQATTGQGWPAAIARVNLGLLLAQQLGDVSGGLAELWTAAASDDPLAAAAGLFNVATVLEDNGDLESAQSAYEKAARLRRPRFSGLAANNLGILLSRQGKLVEAQAAWQTATQIGDPETAAKAQQMLDSLAEVGDLHDFEAQLGQIDLTDPRVKAMMAMNTAEQFLGQGDLLQAHRAYETAMSTGDPFFTPKAAAMVALMFSMAGHGDAGAADAIAHLGEIGFPELEARAWYLYGELSLKRDGAAGAQNCWLRVPESARDAYPAAACALAVLRGDAPAAAAAFRDVLDDAHELAESVVDTALQIAAMHTAAGDAAQARQAYEVSLQLAESAGATELAHTAREALNG